MLPNGSLCFKSQPRCPFLREDILYPHSLVHVLSHGVHFTGFATLNFMPLCISVPPTRL